MLSLWPWFQRKVLIGSVRPGHPVEPRRSQRSWRAWERRETWSDLLFAVSKVDTAGLTLSLSPAAMPCGGWSGLALGFPPPRTARFLTFHPECVFSLSPHFFVDTI